MVIYGNYRQFIHHMCVCFPFFSQRLERNFFALARVSDRRLHPIFDKWQQQMHHNFLVKTVIELTLVVVFCPRIELRHLLFECIKCVSVLIIVQTRIYRCQYVNFFQAFFAHINHENYVWTKNAAYLCNTQHKSKLLSGNDQSCLGLETICLCNSKNNIAQWSKKNHISNSNKF